METLHSKYLGQAAKLRRAAIGEFRPFSQRTYELIPKLYVSYFGDHCQYAVQQWSKFTHGAPTLYSRSPQLFRIKGFYPIFQFLQYVIKILALMRHYRE